MSNAARIYWGISGFFGAKFFFVGIYMPFFPLVLADRGLAAGEIAAIMAIAPLARILTSPLLGTMADRFGDRRKAVFVYATIGTLLLLPLVFVHSFAALMIVTATSSVFLLAVLPVADALAVVAAGQHGLQYGRMRLWGSACFIVANGVAGQALDLAGPDLLVVLILAAAVATMAAALTLPRDGQAATGRRQVVPLFSVPAVREIAARPDVAAILLASALVQGSHAMVYAFGTIHWIGYGLSGTSTGLAWGIGVVAEIALFAWAGRMRGARAAEGLILAGGLAAVIRWGLAPFALEPVSIISLQVLHGITFGATHLGAMRIIAERLPHAHAGGMMGLYTAVTGSIMALAFALSGPVYGRFGGDGFWLMAGLGAMSVGLVSYAMATGRSGTFTPTGRGPAG